MFHRLRLKIQKKYLAFGIIVPLLLATALIRVPCPVCGGTGEISATGMEDVSIVMSDFTLLTTGDVEGCVNYRVYTYSVVMTLQNASLDRDATGYVMLGLVDYTTSKLLATQYAVVTVPKSTETTVAFSTTFTVSLDSPSTTSVTAQPINSELPCQICGGTGKIALNRWPLAVGLKNSYIGQSVNSLPYVAPPIGQIGDPDNPFDTATGEE